EINEIIFTQADEKKRRWLESINSKIIADLMAQFPQLKRNLTPKYNKVFDALDRQVPMQVVARMNPDAPAALLLMGLALGAALVIRRSAPAKSRIGWRARRGLPPAARRREAARTTPGRGKLRPAEVASTTSLGAPEIPAPVRG